MPQARGILAIAAVDDKRSPYDLQVQQVREFGFWTLQRIGDAEVWSMLQRVAAGEPFANMPWFPDEGSLRKPVPTLRAAALRAMGLKNDPAFRTGIEEALATTDLTVRLAAAEAIGQMRRPESFPAILGALETEQHGVVVQALLLAVQRLLAARSQSGASLLTPAEHERALQACIRLLGNSHWRTEMSVVQILAERPRAASIPALIELLKPRKPRRLRDAINASASPVLRHCAWQALRRLTGAAIPEDATAWMAFWEREKAQIKLVQARTAVVPSDQTSSSGPRFYGIPLIGRNIVFLIDTSGSMDEPFVGRRGQRNAMPCRSRLDVAREQILAAVQNMNAKTRYRLLTFADKVTSWNPKPVRPSRRNLHLLTEWTAQLRPHGATNVAEALLQALDPRLPNGSRGRNTPDNEVDELFLMSDGLPAGGPVNEPGKVLKLVREANRYLKVRINTVFTGKGANAADFLRKLAEQNGGVFVQD